MSNPVSGCVPKLIAVADRATRGAIDAAEPLRLLGEALVLVGGVTALMLACLEALRWGNADLYKFVPDGERRVQAVSTAWGLNCPQAD